MDGYRKLQDDTRSVIFRKKSRNLKVGGRKGQQWWTQQKQVATLQII